jgi:Tol biopolymer transport system component
MRSLRGTAVALAALSLLAGCAPSKREAPKHEAPQVDAVEARAAHSNGADRPCDSLSPPVALELVSFTNTEALARTCRDGRPACKNASHPKISADGTRVAFDCDAPDMLSGATPPAGVTQIYVRDVERRRTVLVSGRTTEGQVVFANENTGFPELSGDGKWVVFASKASNLVDGDAEGVEDVFACEVDAQRIVRVSQGFDGTEFNAASSDPSVSHDGRYVAFSSAATNIGPLFTAGGGEPVLAPTDGLAHIYLVDRTIRRFEWLDRGTSHIASAGVSGDPDADRDVASQPVISGDGEVVAFTSNARTLAGEDGNDGQLDIFACRRATGAVELVSVAFESSRGGNGVSRKPHVSGSGRFVVFEGTSTDITPPGVDTNNHSDVFVRDLELGLTARVSVSSTGGQANGASGYGALSFDGRYVAYSSSARNLVPNDTTRGFLDFFVHDRDVSGDGFFDEPGDICTRRLSITPEGVQSNARSGGNCGLSADGRFVVFMSESNLLHPGDDNGFDDKLKCSPTCLFGRDVFRARVY